MNFGIYKYIYQPSNYKTNPAWFFFITKRPSVQCDFDKMIRLDLVVHPLSHLFRYINYLLFVCISWTLQRESKR